MDEFEKRIINAVLTGALAAIAWVLFWSVFIPQVAPSLAWSGHDALVVPVFLVGCAGGAVSKVRP